MPYAGFKSFLLTFQDAEDENFEMCQCPMRALSHFYREKTKEKKYMEIVSMPYAGFKSFLLFTVSDDVMAAEDVSMPYAGFKSFLRF